MLAGDSHPVFESQVKKSIEIRFSSANSLGLAAPGFFRDSPFLTRSGRGGGSAWPGRFECMQDQFPEFFAGVVEIAGLIAGQLAGDEHGIASHQSRPSEGGQAFFDAGAQHGTAGQIESEFNAGRGGIDVLTPWT